MSRAPSGVRAMSITTSRLILSRAAPLEVGRRAAASAGVVAAIMAAITPARAKVASLPMAYTSFGPPVGDLPAILLPRLSGTCGGDVAGPWMVSPGGLLGTVTNRTIERGPGPRLFE